jgi:hypothetical protein
VTPQQARSPGLGEAIGRALADGRSLVADFAELAVLVTAVLLITTWMALVAAGVVIMLGQGASWATALIVAGVLNVAGAGALVWWMLTLIKELPFTALLRQLRGDAPKEPQ